jgi:signal transduction histidine kinase
MGREPEGPYAQIIAREVDRLERIVRDVHGMTRELRPALVETDLGSLVQDCLLLFAERMSQQRIQIRLDLGKKPPILPLDPVQAKQAIMNLMANSVEAMPGGGTITISVHAVRADRGQPAEPSVGQAGTPMAVNQAAGEVPERRGETPTDRPPKGDWVVLSVADTGGGIPEGILDDVFNPFFTTKETGTGLGLALVRRVVRAHGGYVEVQNRPGAGVTFRVWFPTTENPSGATAPA